MTAIELRKYWSNKYFETFGEIYKPKNFSQEIMLLKRLLGKYNEHIILEAIDIFFKSKEKRISSINYFASKKVFEGKFDSLLRLSDIMKYKRFLPFYPENVKSKISQLVQEYQDYSCCETISETEKMRKVKIAKELDDLTHDAIPERT